MGITLLCAAPGTGLSEVAERIRDSIDINVFDVESRMLDSLIASDLDQVSSYAVDGPIDMKALTSAFPRAKVLRLWSTAARECFIDAGKTKNAVVALHLTLFRSDRTEYYSTVSQILDIIREVDAVVGQVVQLIDDVYDMYARLAQDAGALSFGMRYERWLKFTRRATPDLTWERLDGEPSGPAEIEEQVKLETRVQTINMLVGWRRQESIAAESLAGSLNVGFLVLGVKHPMFLLKNLLKNDSLFRIYISHPISAYRREINQLIRGGKQPSANDWNEAVRECNSLPALLGADPRLLAIMPTAIDELRFFPLSEDSAGLTERSFLLGPRWPLINDGNDLISEYAALLPGEVGELDTEESGDNGTSGTSLELISNEAVQRYEVLTRSDSSIEMSAISGELARFLEGLMFIEIPYRDHLIVANTDGFLVHRPRADRARVSGGVKQEVEHWWDRVTNGETHIKIAFLHTYADADNLKRHWLGQASWTDSTDPETLRLRHATVVGAYEGIKAQARAYIGASYKLRNPSDIERVIAGQPLSVDQLGGPSHLATHSAVSKARSKAITAGLAEFLRNELELCVSEQESDGSHVFILDRGVQLTERRMNDVRRFLTGESHYPMKSCTVIGDEENVTTDTFLPFFLDVDDDDDSLSHASVEFFELLRRRCDELTP